MSERPSLKDMRRFLKVMKAITRDQPVDAQEYVRTYEAVFGAPPPVGDEADYATAEALGNAIIDLIQQHGQPVDGPRVSRKLKTPHGLSISMSCMDQPGAKVGEMRFKFVGRVSGKVVFTLLLRQQGVGSNDFRRQLSWEGGAWIDPFIQDWRSMCPTEEGEE